MSGKEPAISTDARSSSYGVSVIDADAPYLFMVGFVSGLTGFNGAATALLVTASEGVLTSMRSGGTNALFRRAPGESPANQIADIAVGIIGGYVGGMVRGRMQAQRQAQAQPVAGLSGITVVR